MFETILFPIDLSREAAEAAKLLQELVRIHNSRVVLLAVQEEDSQDAMSEETTVAGLLQQAHDRLQEAGIEAEIIERTGKPAFVICDVADEIGVNLIVMGCRGMGLTEEGAADSVTNRVINLSPCPILVVP
jgi:nucleotide-binding universal stress UspA family protein